MLAAIEDDLQVQLVPALAGEAFLQVALGLDNVLSLAEFPALGEAVDVGVHREGGHAEGLGHDHGCRFVADARQGFEGFEISGNLASMFFH